MFSGLLVWHALILVALFIVPIVLVIVFARRARRTGNSSSVVSLTLVIASLWAVLGVVGAAVGLVSALAAPIVAVTVPVSSFWPGLLPGVVIDGGPTASVASGGFTDASLMVEGMSEASRALWGVGQFLIALMPTVIAAMIAVACFQLLAGRAFAPAVARFALLTGVVVAVAGTLGEVLSDLGASMVSRELFTVAAAQWSDMAGIEDPFAWWPSPALEVDIPLWPIAVGVAFAALAAIFRYGSALQRDTEGLV